MAKNVLSEATRVNKTACQAHTAEVIILILAYLIEVIKGEKTLGYYAAFVVIGVIPVIIEWLLYKKNTESSAIKHVICIGFAIFYAFVVFTTPNFLSFVYALPIIVALSVYNDKRFTLLANIGVVIMVILVCCGVGAADFSMFTTPMEYKEIMIAVMLVMSSFSVLVSNTTYNVNKDKVEVLNEAKAETEEVLAKVEQNSESLQKGIQNIHVLVSELLDSTASTKAAMEEVGSGSTETAEAVQMQLSQTVVVGEQVDNVDEITKLILDKMNESVDAVKSGNDNLAELIKEVNLSVSNGEEVAGKLSELNGRIDEMNSIISMINSISSQTSLLALNASIEAARAGEAGRGFAVVAGEISNLSTQTQDATSKITSLISNVAGAIAEVITVINTMIEGINSEKESTASAEESFKTIGEDINAIMTSVEELNTGVASLKAANNEISDSVQTISAISEEVSAHASETIGSEEANVVRLNSIMEKANELLEAAAN